MKAGMSELQSSSDRCTDTRTKIRETTPDCYAEVCPSVFLRRLRRRYLLGLNIHLLCSSTAQCALRVGTTMLSQQLSKKKKKLLLYNGRSLCEYNSSRKFNYPVEGINLQTIARSPRSKGHLEYLKDEDITSYLMGCLGCHRHAVCKIWPSFGVCCRIELQSLYSHTNRRSRRTSITIEY